MIVELRREMDILRGDGTLESGKRRRGGVNGEYGKGHLLTKQLLLGKTDQSRRFACSHRDFYGCAI